MCDYHSLTSCHERWMSWWDYHTGCLWILENLSADLFRLKILYDDVSIIEIFLERYFYAAND